MVRFVPYMYTEYDYRHIVINNKCVILLTESLNRPPLGLFDDTLFYTRVLDQREI